MAGNVRVVMGGFFKHVLEVGSWGQGEAITQVRLGSGTGKVGVVAARVVLCEWYTNISL